MIILKSTHNKEIAALQSKLDKTKNKVELLENLMYFRTEVNAYLQRSSFYTELLCYNGSVISFRYLERGNYVQIAESKANYYEETKDLLNELRVLEELCMVFFRNSNYSIQEAINVNDKFHELLKQINKISHKYI